MANYDVVLPPAPKVQILNFPDTEQIPSWGWDYMRFRDLHEHNKGESAIGFVIDDAEVYDHPDLIENSLHQYARSFVQEDRIAQGGGHSHHVAGIMAARDNKRGVIGGAPRMPLVPVQALGANGGYWSWIANAITYSADVATPDVGNKRRILNLSIGGQNNNKLVEDAIAYAIEERNCIVVIAGGNDASMEGKSTVNFPGRLKAPITVSSIDPTGVASFFTSTGPEIDFGAPGDYINSTHLNGKYVRLPGSSMATPHVSALCALIVGMYKGITNAEVKELLAARLQKQPGYRKNWETGHGVPISHYYELPNQPVKNPDPVDEIEPDKVQPAPDLGSERKGCFSW